MPVRYSPKTTFNHPRLNPDGICSFAIIKDAGHSETEDIMEDLSPYIQMSRREREETDEHQHAQTYWVEKGAQGLSSAVTRP